MSKQVYQIKCENCGAKIDPKKMCCDYCGTKLFTEQKTEKEHDAIMAQKMLHSFTQNTEVFDNKTPIIVVIVFMIIWTTAAFFGAITAFRMGLLMGIVPALMGIFGIVIMISAIKSWRKQKKEKNNLF